MKPQYVRIAFENVNHMGPAPTILLNSILCIAELFDNNIIHIYQRSSVNCDDAKYTLVFNI